MFPACIFFAAMDYIRFNCLSNNETMIIVLYNIDLWQIHKTISSVLILKKKGKKRVE